jgi:HTH-type transcriptional regulator/antitoxin HigA
MLEQKGMTRADLHELMGGKARVSEFFAGKRSLSVAQIRALREELGIPADLLIG